MRKLWQDEAWEEYLYWQTQDIGAYGLMKRTELCSG